MSRDDSEDRRKRIDGTLLATLDQIVKGIAADPEGVTIRTVSSEEVTILNLRVTEDDYGKVLGKKRTTLDAIRAILDKVGRRFGIGVFVELGEPYREWRKRFTIRWNRAEFESILESVLKAAFSVDTSYEVTDSDGVALYEVRVEPGEIRTVNDKELPPAFETVFSGIARTMNKRLHLTLILPEEYASPQEAVSAKPGEDQYPRPYEKQKRRGGWIPPKGLT